MKPEEWQQFVDILEAMPSEDLKKVLIQTALMLNFRNAGNKNETNFSGLVYPDNENLLPTNVAIWIAGGNIAKMVSAAFNKNKKELTKNAEE